MIYSWLQERRRWMVCSRSSLAGAKLCLKSTPMMRMMRAIHDSLQDLLALLFSRQNIMLRCVCLSPKPSRRRLFEGTCRYTRTQICIIVTWRSNCLGNVVDTFRMASFIIAHTRLSIIIIYDHCYWFALPFPTWTGKYPTWFMWAWYTGYANTTFSCSLSPMYVPTTWWPYEIDLIPSENRVVG